MRTIKFGTRVVFALVMLLSFTSSVWAHPEEGATGIIVAAVEVEPYDVPRIAAPGVNIPIAWAVTGLASVTETGIKWDTVSHAHDNNYSNDAPSGYATVGNNYANIIAPSQASEIFFKAYAVSGATYWSSREYNVKYERPVNVGKDTWYGGWEPDRDWETEGYGYGYVGGEAYFGGGFDIQGTEDDWLYYRQRIGLSSYHFYVGRGTYEATYEVELHFAELQKSSMRSGRRLPVSGLSKRPSATIRSTLSLSGRLHSSVPCALAASTGFPCLRATVRWNSISTIPTSLTGRETITAAILSAWVRGSTTR